jgi:hypothetical protein
LKSAVDRIGRFEASVDHRIQALADEFRTAMTTQEGQTAALRVQTTAFKDGLGEMSQTLQRRIEEIRYPIRQPLASAQGARQITTFPAQSNMAVGELMRAAPQDEAASPNPLRPIAHRTIHFPVSEVAHVFEKSAESKTSSSVDQSSPPS